MIKKFDKKDEESGSGSNPFRHLEKSAVLQEARIFNETPINPRRCLHILTKILYLLNQGEHFGTTEATEAFFAMTRLFQSNDQTLRRMCYLTIKEMATISEDVIIVTSSHESPVFDFIESCLRNKHEMVIYEAASAIIHLPNCTARELAPAVSVLQLFCSSPKPALRYAAVRTLNKVAMKHPSAVTACNLDLENLITDSNRSIATLAITTLLKTGSESSVDRLMKQISSFVSEISDEFKVVVVQAISALCQKYPRKHSVMMTFLSNMLRDDGGFEYKRAIVDCIIHIVEENPESKEAGLAHLCEFIEDCEHTVLATKILHLLGKEGPRTPVPSKYIRFIFNRVVLENEAVRAAAVSALAKFGAQNENLLPSILVLLQRCMMDTDDEVRDRATFYLNVLQQRQMALNATYIFNGLTVSVPGMEKALHQYTLEPSEKPFDMKSIPLATAPVFEQKAEITLVSTKPEKLAPSRQDIFQEQLAAIPEFMNLGPLFKSSEPVQLTEAETEYFVRCVKHMFTNHIVFQFDCTNTLNDQLLEKVTVQVEPSEAYEVLCCVPAPSLPYNQPGVCYTLVRLPEDDSIAGTNTQNTGDVIKSALPLEL
ncbi:coatomer subunit gamma-2 isoform X3 [Bos mutus]|uniref:coatomer subunit gamma-2 isoform X3 n=1 Tax=Bos mutus TaxID=72004 RepID=UPI0038B660CC